MGRPKTDLTGQRFTRLIVQERAGTYVFPSGYKQTVSSSDGLFIVFHTAEARQHANRQRY